MAKKRSAAFWPPSNPFPNISKSCGTKLSAGGDVAPIFSENTISVRSMCNGARISPGPSARPGLLHVFPSFAVGGVPLRMVRVLNRLGPGFSHVIVALDGRFEAAKQFEPSTEVSLLPAPGRGG